MIKSTVLWTVCLTLSHILIVMRYPMVASLSSVVSFMTHMHIVI